MPKRPNNQSPMSTQRAMTMEQLQSKLDDLVLENEQLKNKVAALEHRLSTSTGAPDVAGPQCQVKSIFSYGCPPSSMFAKTATGDLAATRPDIAYLTHHIDIARTANLMAQKSMFAVVENLPEPTDISVDKSKRQSSKGDTQLVKQICMNANITPPRETWRHPSRSQVKPRPLKVQFESVAARDDFLREFNRNLPTGFTGRRPSSRRDMTPAELSLLYELRREAYARNQAAGQVAFVIRDLEIIELKSPRPFRQLSCP